MCLLGTSEKRILKVFVWKAPRKIGRHARRQMTNGNRKTPSSSANSEDRNENSTVVGKLSEDSPSANWFAATTEDVVASIIRLILEIPKCPAKTIVAVYQRTIITLRSHLDEIGRPLLSLSSIFRLIERCFRWRTIRQKIGGRFRYWNHDWLLRMPWLALFYGNLWVGTNIGSTERNNQSNIIRNEKCAEHLVLVIRQAIRRSHTFVREPTRST